MLCVIAAACSVRAAMPSWFVDSSAFRIANQGNLGAGFVLAAYHWHRSTN